MTDIAITGLGCRFPGARDTRAYWKLLMSAERQFSPVPAERWNHGTFHEPGNHSATHAAYTDQVAFLDGVDRFDALHYGVPPARARAMDPQHRLMLDVTREALEDAGMGRGDFDRENTGVFFGISVSDYKDLMAAPLRAISLAEQEGAADGSFDRDAAREQAQRFGTVQSFTLPGSLLNMASGTVSRQFDLGGPSFAVDAACSGSLVALDQAIAQLHRGACRIAVVGGVYLNLTPDSLIGFSRLRALSAAGVCRPFDAEADGFVLGEGAGTVVIRPLADALAAGDRVYAVIRGIGSANDGASPGPLVPTAEGQLRAMRRAYEDAGVPPSSVGFLEAHGTGTAAGDRAEIEALRRLRTEWPDDDPSLCYLGSGKALIGHSLSAAGIAGLIKTALVVHHRTIVPQPRTAPHPELGVAAAGLRFAEAPRPWADGNAPLRAAVSSFGFGGTNVHVVLEERPAPAPAGPPPEPPFHGAGTPQLVLLSAGSPRLLDRHIGDVLGALEALDPADRPPLGALAHTLGGRQPLKTRLAIVAADTEEFTERLRRARRQLEDGARGDLGDDAFAAEAPLPAAQRRIALLYPGQGSQRPGMMRDLYERYAGFRTAVDALGAVAGPDTAALLYGTGSARGQAEEAMRRLTATEVCQPVLGTVQVAATRFLADCGITPDLTLGHSVGEFAAAAAAGALTGEDTVRLLAGRGAALGRAAKNGPPGGMLAVQTDEETCRRLVEGIDGVWPACFNEQRQIVVSGTAEGLAALREACAGAGVVTVALEVAGAFHSPLLAPAEEEVRTLLAARRIVAPVVPFVSSVNGERCADPAALRGLWARHASAPVRFGDAVRTAYEQGARVFLQVNGGSSLLTPVRRTLYHHDDVHLFAADAVEREDGRGFVRTLARLAVLGAPVDPRGLVPAEHRRLLDLPPAELDTQSYWVPGKRPAPAGRATARPVAPTEPPSDDTADELLRMIRHQAALLTHLTNALPSPRPAPAQTPPDPAPATVTAPSDTTQADTAQAEAGQAEAGPASAGPAEVGPAEAGPAVDATAGATPPADAQAAAAPVVDPRAADARAGRAPAATGLAGPPPAAPDPAGAAPQGPALTSATAPEPTVPTRTTPAARLTVPARGGVGAASADRVPAPPASVPAPAGPLAPRVPAREEPVPAATAPEASSPPAGSGAADTTQAGAAADVVTESVFAHVARVSAFPVSHLRGDQLLVDDLGFDSLMLTDLFTALARQWPQWALDERAADRPTIAGLAALIAAATPVPVPQAVPEPAATVAVPEVSPEAAPAAAPTGFSPPAAPARAATPAPAPGMSPEAAPAAVPEVSPEASPEAAPVALPAPPAAPAAAAPAAGPAPGCDPPPAGHSLPDAHTRIECFPEVARHGERLALLDRTGLANPYFLVHEGGLTGTTVVDGRELVSFSGYNYLGMATDPQVTAAATEAVERYGTSVSASRLLSGNRPLHLELEAELAGLLGCEDALALANGHATNVTVIGHLVGPGDLVVHDALAHDSILQGCRLSGATRRPFPHDDAAALDALLAQIRHQYRRVLVVVEGVYSMDGDIADLPALIEVKRRHGALLMVDEAHSIGTIGPTGGGVGEYHGVDRAAVDLWAGTLSKALAGCGGYVAGTDRVVSYLRYTAPGFVYSAGLTPADTAASLAALRLLRAEPERVARLTANAALFTRLARAAGLDTGDSHDTPVVPCIIGDSAKTLRLAEALFRQGISVNPILHPAVPEEKARLRFFVTRDHTPEQIRRTVTALTRELRRLDAAESGGAADAAPAAA
ncbi:8-amino-7-oxononanoate synthase [Streptomyces sp. 3211.6]|uniref:type I polyketide synthase n=1 Tax=Streptomyces sp. 3211.6 TaxID=1938845 RepID=UPI000F18526E|nr:type I polyketide synthase [Streptomyces sp. 3211.6]RKT03029.1 8-amino-7-oxononanoate synthase [Streptomyces sp. 3211.6]